MKQKHLKRRIGTVIVAWIMLLSGSLPVSAAMLEITGTFGDRNVGKWLTAMVLSNNDTAVDPIPENITYITQEKIKSDGSFNLKLPIMQETDTFRSNLPINADTGKYFYVSSMNGSSDGTGSAASPVNTMQKAFELAEDGDTIVLLDTVRVSSWDTSKSLTVTGQNPITGVTEGGIDLTEIVSLRICGPVKFEKLKFVTKAAASMDEKANRIFACGNSLVMGEGLTMTEPIDILGGNSIGNTAESTDLTLLSGCYRRIYGGGWNSPVNGDTHIVIGGTVNSEYSVEDSSQNYYDSRVFGGGVYSGSEVAGETYITIKDNAAIAYVVGGGSGIGTDIKGGATHISIDGGRVMNVYGGTVDKTTVYKGDTYINMSGGSVEGIFGGSMSQTMTGNTRIAISGGQVTRRIYGGCYNDWSGSWNSNFHVDGTTAVWVGGDARLITGEGLSSGNKDNSGIFAASRASSNLTTENSYLIFADGTYDKWKDKIGDVSGWSGTFKPYNDYLVKAGNGGTAILDNNTIGALDLTAEEGKIAFCNGQQTENGIYNIKDAETVIEFSQIAEVTPTPTASPTASPTAEPTATPTAEPTATPTVSPTAGPIAEPTATPTVSPTAEPTATPTASPTAGPITEPTATPTVSPTPEQSAKLTENGAEVSADIALEKFEGGERILAAVYNSDRQLVTAKITEITENGNYKLNLDFTPIPTERYTIKLFVWKLHEMKPLNNGYSFGPLGGE